MRCTRRPRRLSRHRPNAPVRCLEDTHFSVEHLVPAVDLGDPDSSVRYVQYRVTSAAAAGRAHAATQEPPKGEPVI